MEPYLGLDVPAWSCTLAVLSESGKRLRDLLIATNGQALIESIRTIPGRKHLCIEEGTQSGWLNEILKLHFYELVVATVAKHRAQGLARSAWPGCCRSQDRYTILSDRLLDQLREYWRLGRPQPYLFASGHSGHPLSRESAGKIYEAA